jgi:long-chain acyl-CoA synthetase
MTANLASKLISTVARAADRPALRFGETVVSYAELDDRSARVADLLLGRGLAPGDRVGVMLPNTPQFAYVYYGVLRAGGVVVPLNVLLKRREVSHYLSDSGAEHLLAWSEFADAAEAGAADADAACLLVRPGAFEESVGAAPALAGHVVPRSGHDTAVILYTSGTTGKPKGAELTHANLTRNAEVVVDLFSLGGDDVMLGALPLFHSFGQTCALNACVAVGASLAIVSRFDPVKVLETVAHHGVTIFQGVPTMYSALLQVPDRERFDTSSWRLCVSGGAAMPVEVLQGFEAAFDCIVLEGYGLSETSPVACFNHAHSERLPGSIGTPVEGVEMRLAAVDNGVGEILIRGHNVMKGYWNDPKATAAAIDADGWFHTGDLARVDAQGRYFVVDRKKDMVIRGGYNVYPREIEEVLHEHPAVREAAVIGMPHASHGEEVVAAVSVADGAEVTPTELKEFVRERVAAYKYPRHVWILDELPKGPTGKILKREIRIPDFEPTIPGTS